jgi:hypothetical protein
MIPNHRFRISLDVSPHRGVEWQRCEFWAALTYLQVILEQEWPIPQRIQPRESPDKGVWGAQQRVVSSALGAQRKSVRWARE